MEGGRVWVGASSLFVVVQPRVPWLLGSLLSPPRSPVLHRSRRRHRHHSLLGCLLQTGFEGEEGEVQCEGVCGSQGFRGPPSAEADSLPTNCSGLLGMYPGRPHS